MVDLLRLSSCNSSNHDQSLIGHLDGCPDGSCSNDDDSTPCLACKECKARQDRIDDLETQVENLKRQQKAWEHDELGLRKQLSDLYAGENARFRSWKDQLERMSANQNEITRLERELWRVEHNNKVLNQSLERHKEVSKALNELQKEVDELQGKLPKQFVELQQMLDTYKTYKNEARDLHAECGKLQEEIGKQSREIADLTRQRDDWKDVAMSRMNLTPPQPSDGDTPGPAVVMGDQSGQKPIKKRGLPTSFTNPIATAKSSRLSSAQKGNK